MKGTKEILNWLLDNPMKEIKRDGWATNRYNIWLHRFEYKLDGEWIGKDDLYSFEGEWHEVKTPIEWQEAIQDCLDNGTEYLSWYGEFAESTYCYKMYRQYGKVKIKSLSEEHIVSITCKWVKA